MTLPQEVALAIARTMRLIEDANKNGGRCPKCRKPLKAHVDGDDWALGCDCMYISGGKP